MTGWYLVSHVTFTAQKIIFTHDALASAAAQANPVSVGSRPGAASYPTKSPIIRVFPRPNALEAKLELPRHVFLGENKSVEVIISSGWNDVARAELRVRAASAGLRLQTADARTSKGPVRIINRPRPGVLELGTIPANTTVRMKIPYALEQDLRDLSVRLPYALSYPDFQYHLFLALMADTRLIGQGRG